jgi:galactokinase/mevalonate kinase-like predicted kinase
MMALRHHRREFTMDSRHESFQFLLTLPPQVAARFEELEQRRPPGWFAASDPPGRNLGSGGATAQLVAQAWRKMGQGQSFDEWLVSSRKIILHGGGDARRLPAYASVGKMLMPIPVLRWSRGQSLTQRLLDLQMPDYLRVLDHAPDGVQAMVASGDVLLRFGRRLPSFPSVDVLGLGMWAAPDQARHFGVFFMARRDPSKVEFLLQKPSPSEIRELGEAYLPLVDTGLWLLSQRAVAVLMERCGWSRATSAFVDGDARTYELYAQFGLALGHTPRLKDPELNSLTCAVVPLPEAAFHHFGTSRQMIESMTDLQNVEVDATKLGLVGARRRPSQHLLNARFDYPLRLEENHTLWIENSTIPDSWRLAHSHVLCGVPPNHWDLSLEPGVCLHFAPVGPDGFCVQACGIDDDLAGPLDAGSTRWFGRPAAEWFARRLLTPEQAGVKSSDDLGDAPIFPVLKAGDIDAHFLEWLFAEHPKPSKAHAQRWLSARRYSTAQVAAETNLDRLYRQRASLMEECLVPMMRNHRFSVFYRLDLASTAALFARTGQALPEPVSDEMADPLQTVHDAMFRAAVLRNRGGASWEKHETRSFGLLQEMIVREAQLAPVQPRCAVLEDQIVWGRSPVRLDLAGGWTDTPPYCLEHGGRVLNVAVDLNGQPPIQVFARVCQEPELVLRSIDLGVEQRIHTYAELDTYARPGSEFGLAKAALALAGFLPQFHANSGAESLERQLRDFGGGIELSMLCAVPKGSGLGTSSILAATLLATLGDVCGLGWEAETLFGRTLALEQMLTTGGGWQDQAGAIYRGVKLVETEAGLAQKPTLRWLPEHLLNSSRANRSILLYYTGITRLAKNILQEIVRGIFLNSPGHLRIVDQIGENAIRACDAFQTCRAEALETCIRRSWELNQRLDSGTNPPEVQAILSAVQDEIAAAKLLGAGGGGYLLMFARDEAAAGRIRQTLVRNPPNARARFVDFSVSSTGLQLTRS